MPPPSDEFIERAVNEAREHLRVYKANKSSPSTFTITTDRDQTLSTETTETKSGMQFKDVDVVRDGKHIVLPVGMSLKEGREWLLRREKEENQVVGISEAVDAYPLEGAYAFAKAISRMFGFSALVPTPGFFGATPPKMIGMEVSVTEKAQVPWGRVEIPGIRGYLTTGMAKKEGRIIFTIGGEVLQGDRAKVKELADMTRKIVSEESVYKGKAIRVKFVDPENEQFNVLDCPVFMDTSKTRPEELIFSESLKRAIETSIFTPISRTQLCRDHGIPLKRGVLLEGKYGTGKTLTASIAARKCEENGWTFIYLNDVSNLKQAIGFAKAYQPACIFAEDIDRVMDGERDDDMDSILNTIDGVDTKAMELIVILTTNSVENIEPAMMRPGRLDAVITVCAPDAEAVVKLLKLYGRGRLHPQDDFTSVGKKLEGHIPAVIREVVERSKLAAIGRLQEGQELLICSVDLESAADQMLNHLKLMEQRPEDDRSELVKAAATLGAHVITAFVPPAAKPTQTNGKSERSSSYDIAAS